MPDTVHGPMDGLDDHGLDCDSLRRLVGDRGGQGRTGNRDRDRDRDKDRDRGRDRHRDRHRDRDRDRDRDKDRDRQTDTGQGEL